MLSKFSRKLRENLENFEIWIDRGFGGGAPPPMLAKIVKNSRKINGKLQNFVKIHEILANFDLKQLIVLKEIKKPSDRFLRVWAKTN